MGQLADRSCRSLRSVNPPGADIDAANGQPQGTAAHPLLPSFMSHHVRPDKPDVLAAQRGYTGGTHGPGERSLIIRSVTAYRGQ